MGKKILIPIILLVIVFLFSGCINLNIFEPEVHVKEFTITLFDFGINPDTITIHRDETVVIKIKGETAHSFTIDEYNVNVRVNKNETAKTIFTPTQTGSFVYYCNIASHNDIIGHDNMTGTLKVK